MSLPKRVTIFGYKVKVVLNDDIDNHGACDPAQKIIWIRKSDSLKTQRETLIHEILHMILGIGGVSYMLHDDLEEAVVRCLEGGLVPLLSSVEMFDP
jgi:Zn-dependent peptidase ImmA (M78 family)